MSRDGQRCSTADEDAAVMVASFPMAEGTTFNWHTHDEHQVAWAGSGVLTVLTGDTTWVLPPTRALWIPAGLRHETRASGRATLQSLYIRPDLFAVSWLRPTPIRASRLLVELVDYLAAADVGAAHRGRAEALLGDLLEPLPVATIELRHPTDPRALDVARALAVDPADARTLEQWGHHVGASGRTLARQFRTETGVPFGRWRTLLRLQAALPALAGGAPVGAVARSVGYDTASAFVAAFRRETGMTPAQYFV